MRPSRSVRAVLHLHGSRTARNAPNRNVTRPRRLVGWRHACATLRIAASPARAASHRWGLVWHRQARGGRDDTGAGSIATSRGARMAGAASAWAGGPHGGGPTSVSPAPVSSWPPRARFPEPTPSDGGNRSL